MTTLNTMNLIKELNEEFMKEYELKDHKGELEYGALIDLFREENDEAIMLVKRLIMNKLGQEEQYVFWYLLDMLCCPTSSEVSYEMVRPLKDLNII